MKKVLIVVPNCGTGGVLASLIALLNSSFVRRYHVNIFIMNAYGVMINPTIAKYDIGCNYWTSKVYSYVRNTHGMNRIVLLGYKIIFKIPWIGKRIIDYIDLSTIRRIEKFEYDCVISFQERVSQEFVSKFSNPQKIAWIHCDYSRIFTNETDEMKILSNYTKIVTVSKYTQQSLCELLPKLKDRIVVIYNIMDYDVIRIKANKTIDDNRFSTDYYTIISVGRISSVKQFEKVPLVANSLKSKGYSFRWYIIGGVNDTSASEKLNKAIEDNKMQDVVICLGNKLNPYPYFKAANLLVSTSLSEACPMVFNEAKILKLPIVTNCFGSSYEFIEDGQDGRICTIDQMADVIGEIISFRPHFCPQISKGFSSIEIQNQIDNIINNS
ncbi:MAG: glycosyltransferase [Bacteroidales bacterium]|nr:glycosyltransferase [Bacteroidales bacterium]